MDTRGRVEGVVGVGDVGIRFGESGEGGRGERRRRGRELMLHGFGIENWEGMGFR
jgi:hypothetical protein